MTDTANFNFFDQTFVITQLQEAGVADKVPNEFKLLPQEAIFQCGGNKKAYPNEVVMLLDKNATDRKCCYYLEFHKETKAFVTLKHLRFLTEEEEFARDIIRQKKMLADENISHVDMYESLVHFKDGSAPKPVDVFIRKLCAWDDDEDRVQEIEPFNIWKRVMFMEWEFKDEDNLPSNDDHIANADLVPMLDTDSRNYKAFSKFNINAEYTRSCNIGNGWELAFGSHIEYEEFICMWKYYPDTDRYKCILLMMGYFCPNQLMGMDSNYQVLEYPNGEPVVTDIYNNEHVKENRSMLLAHRAGMYPCLKELVEREMQL